MTAPSWLVERPIAHRGLHDGRSRFENTVGAAEAAVAAAFAIECDVQLSADGEAMVFHDGSLDRLTEARGPIASLAAAGLGRLTVGGSADTIPTLPAFLDRIGGRVPLVIEIKSRFDGDDRLARRCAALLDGRAEPVALKSFDPAIVALLRELVPDRPRGIVAQSSYERGDWDAVDAGRRHAMSHLLHWDETRPDFLSWRHGDLPNAATHLPRLLAGIPVMTWTIRSQAEAERVRGAADAIVFEGFTPA